MDAGRLNKGVGAMPSEETQQRPAPQGHKRKDILSPELREVLHMLKSLEAKPAAG